MEDTFLERVWRKWVSPRLLEFRGRTIRETISEFVEEAERLTPEQLLIQGSKKGILFYGIEALERGANISAEDDDALRQAAANGHYEILVYLVERGAKISAREENALRTATANGHFEIVRYLVERGANISAEENEALRWAARNGSFEIVRYLVESGANISARNVTKSKNWKEDVWKIPFGREFGENGCRLDFRNGLTDRFGRRYLSSSKRQKD